jgi:hypothetical protein
MKRTDNSFSIIKKCSLFMAGYSYAKRSVHPSWLVTITLKEVSALFMAGYNTSFSVILTSHEESEHFF